MSLRSRLDKQGYILVNKNRWQSIQSMNGYIEDLYRQRQTASTENYQLADKIKELQAEIEAHKRVEAVLAERSIGLP